MGLLRVLLFDVVFVLLTVVLGLVGLGVRAFRRELALPLARTWTSLSIAALRVIAGVRYEVVGAEHLRPGALILAAQHRSALDALVWFTLLDGPAYVMKRELKRLPLVGPLLEPAGMIAVDRTGGSQALRRMLRDAEAALRGGRQLVIFPEGTRVLAGDRVPLWPGIAALAGRGAPILPVATNSGSVWGRSVLARRRPAARMISLVIEPPLPEGVKRETLITAIEEAWTRGERRFL